MKNIKLFVEHSLKVSIKNNMRYEYKHLLKSSKKNFFLSIYLLIKYFFLKNLIIEKLKIGIYSQTTKK